PKPRDFSLKMSKKMKRLALFSALSAKKNANEIKAVKGLDSLGPKTKLMVEVLNNLEINNKDKNILLVLSGKSTKDLENIYRSARNIEGLNIINADILNAYDALNNKLILLMESSIEHMKERFLKESI
ncbi:MAG: 50S ribosomal protein L4, partial [Candidatus Levybacteria bacterium RIFCSPHIGHO2_12_FULL_37_9]